MGPTSATWARALPACLALMTLGCCEARKGVLLGQVLNPDGSPCAGADVAALPFDPSKPWNDLHKAIWQRTDRRGRFRFSLRPGPHAITASHPTFIGANVGRLAVDPGTTYTLPFPLRLLDGGTPLGGEILRDRGRRVEGVLGLVPQGLDPSLTVASVRLALIRDGRYQVGLAPGTYFFLPWTQGFWHPGAWVEVGPRPCRRDAVLVREPCTAPREARQAVKAHASPMEPVDGAGLAALDALLDGNVVLGLGEATHGASEFQRILHRVAQRVAERGQARAIALEMTVAEAFAVDDFIQGTGSEPFQALPLAYRTREMEDLLRWLRRLNLSRIHGPRFRVHGIDPADPGPAYRWALAFADRHDPCASALLRLNLADLGRARERGYPDDQVRAERWQAALGKLHHRLEATAKSLPGESRAIERQRGCLAALAQFIPLAVDRAWGPGARDLGMADNVLRILRQEGLGGHVLLYAHLGHVARTRRDSLGWPTLGWHLGHTLGSDYAAVGMTFQQGAFMALGSNATPPAWRPFQVGPEPRATLEEALASTGLSGLFLDLHSARLVRKGPRWLQSPQGMRQIPLEFDPACPECSVTVLNACEDLDALIFLERVSPTRPRPHPRPSPDASPFPAAG